MNHEITKAMKKADPEDREGEWDAFVAFAWKKAEKIMGHKINRRAFVAGACAGYVYPLKDACRYKNPERHGYWQRGFDWVTKEVQR